MNTAFFTDLLDRAVRTFCQAFLATFSVAFIAPQNTFDITAWKAAGAAALVGSVSAAISAVMSMLAKRVGDPNSASLTQPGPGPVNDLEAGVKQPAG